MKTIARFTIPAVMVIFLVTAANGAPKTRILQEVVGIGQSLQHLNGMPVVISSKNYTVVITPENILLKSDVTVRFNLMIVNPTETPLDFSMGNISVSSSGGKLHILSPDELIAESRKFYSKEDYNLSPEQAKMLTPFVDEKMARLREKMMTSRMIAPAQKVTGIIAIKVPFGTDYFSIDVVIGDEHHEFEFNVGEF